MARVATPLTIGLIRKTKPASKPVKLTDGGGMYLLLQPEGSRYWRLDYRFEGKRKTLALGVYPDVSLKEARKRRHAARTLLAEGLNPAAVRKASKSNHHPIINPDQHAFALAIGGEGVWDWDLS
ncbi:MAG: Arm DNA-binding domain-containing protein, partial [Gammaproteobacteria bacterium]|nr:Arm DNA-binding domain-containing protein [Gammaproteobacteria bacterium]